MIFHQIKEQHKGTMRVITKTAWETETGMRLGVGVRDSRVAVLFMHSPGHRDEAQQLASI
jgi:hypothetical protein